jgi:hypothetical protein
MSFTKREKVVYSLRPENRFKLDPQFIEFYVGKQPAWGFGLLSYVTFKRTYARRVTKAQLKDEAVRYLKLTESESDLVAEFSTQTTEEYWQTCVRVVEGVSSILKQHVRDTGQSWSDDEEQHHAQEMFRRMWDFKFTPPGRGLWGMGTEALELKGSAILNNCGFVSTKRTGEAFSEPFCTLMDYSMLGVGMGFDVKGAGKMYLRPAIRSTETFVVQDTREGWIDALRTVLDAYVGKGALPISFNFDKVRKEGLPLKTFGGTSSGPAPLARLLDRAIALCEQYVDRFVDARFIVDAMNIIGVCVVAGNVRRSSEIAIGDADDTEFLSLKNNDELNALFGKQFALAAENADWSALNGKIQKLRAKQYGLSVLDEKYAKVQRSIDKLTAKQKEILAALPEWVELQKQIEDHPLMTHRWASNNTALCEVGATDYAPIIENTIRNGEPGLAWPAIYKAFGRLADTMNNKDRNAEGFNPCGEQTLHDMELCCLVETYPTKHKSVSDFLATLKYAYRYAKAVTLVPTHNPKTNAVMVRNRRIGTSMAGIAEMYSKLGLTECTNWWNAGYHEICAWDTEYSSWLGVNESIKKTSIKPGGTTPLLVGVEGGAKYPTAQYYMRTIRIDHISPLVAALKEAGYRVERDRTTPRTMVVYFPCRAPEGVRLASNTSVWEQAAVFTALQRYWSDNMVSVTLTFQPHEAQDLVRLVQAYEGQWKCVSFLPLSTHGYLQAPYTPCTEEEYLAARAKLSPVTFDGLTVSHDTEDKFCSGGICEIGAKR